MANDDKQTRRGTRADDDQDREEAEISSLPSSPSAEAGAVAPSPPGATPSPTPPALHHLSDRLDEVAASATATGTVTAPIPGAEPKKKDEEPPVRITETGDWFLDRVQWNGMDVYVCKACGHRSVGKLVVSGEDDIENHVWTKHRLVQAQANAQRRGLTGLVRPDGTPL